MIIMIHISDLVHQMSTTNPEFCIYQFFCFSKGCKLALFVKINNLLAFVCLFLSQSKIGRFRIQDWLLKFVMNKMQNNAQINWRKIIIRDRELVKPCGEQVIRSGKLLKHLSFIGVTFSLLLISNQFLFQFFLSFPFSFLSKSKALDWLLGRI